GWLSNRDLVTATTRLALQQGSGHCYDAAGSPTGIWSLLRRGWLSNVAFSTPEHLAQRIRRGLRHIQYRSDLIDGCLAETGLTIRPA
ncbi:hypothetical protein AB0C83_41480, partial [Streptomyces sp. NPDC048663]